MNPPAYIDGTQPPTGDERWDALIRFYAAFNGRDLTGARACWDDAPQVSMSNPLGGVKRGWPEIETVYRRIFGGETSVRVEFFDVVMIEGQDLFVAAGRERGTATRRGRTLELRIRTTRVYRRVDGIWRQIHHHGSMDEPELLKEYRDLLAAV